MALFARDLRYLTGHLWARWVTAVFAFAALAIPGILLLPLAFFVPADPTYGQWIVEGRKLCGLVLVLPLACALIAAPLLGVRLMLVEAAEGTLEVLRTTPMTGLEVFLEKLAVALWVTAPLLLASAPVLAFGWAQGWISAVQILSAVGLSAATTAAATAVAMALAGLARSPEVAYPLVMVVLAGWAIGWPPFDGAPATPLGWLFFSPAKALVLHDMGKGDFPVTPAEWAGCFAWCAAAGAAAVALGARLLFAADAERGRRWTEGLPYVAGGAAVLGLAATGVVSGVPGSTSASLAALAAAAWIVGARLRPPAAPGSGPRHLIARKEVAFYESGGLRVLRDALALGVLAYGLLSAQNPALWSVVAGPARTLMITTLGILLVLGVALGATSLTLERGRNTFELLVLTPVPLDDVLRGKLRGIARHLAPILLAFVVVAAPAGGWSAERVAGVLLAAACVVPWVLILILYGMGVGAGAKTNGQAIAACLGVFWLVRMLWETSSPRSTSPWWVAWYTLKEAFSPFHYGEHSLTLGGTFPGWNPLGFLFGLASYALVARLMYWALRAAARRTARTIDPWGEVGSKT